MRIKRSVIRLHRGKAVVGEPGITEAVGIAVVRGAKGGG